MDTGSSAVAPCGEQQIVLPLSWRRSVENKVMNYLDFDLIIEPSDNGYRARVFNSPAGEAEREFALPFSDLEIENFVLRLGQSRRGVRRLETAALASVKTFGGQLFDALFDGEMKACFLGSVQEAARSGSGLRRPRNGSRMTASTRSRMRSGSRSMRCRRSRRASRSPGT